MAATSPTHIQNGEQQTVSVSGERPAPVRPGPERLRLAFRRLSRGWHEFFLSGPGTDFAVYPPPERPVVVEEAGANVAGDQLAVAASGPLRRDGSIDGPLSALARRLGPRRLASVRWTAGAGDLTITAGPCPPRRWAPSGPWRFTEVAAPAPGRPSSFAEEVASAFGPSARRRRGSALELEVSYRIGPDLDWTSLWGPTALALGLTSDGNGGLLVGRSIVRTLALHRIVDQDIGDGVRIGLWWRPAGTAPRIGPQPARKAGADPAPAPVAFDRDESGYLAWIAANPGGYVLNAPKRAAPAKGVTVHGASCRLVSGDGGGARRWTATSRKVCSESRAGLVAWAQDELGADPTSCRICGG